MTIVFLPARKALTQEEERALVLRCIQTLNPGRWFKAYVRGLCSLTNLFVPACASFLREWLAAVAVDSIANARTGANVCKTHVSMALQPIYPWKLFMLLGGHLLLSGCKPTDADLRLLEAMTTDPDISKGHRELVRAFIGVNREDALEAPSVFAIIFILQNMKRDGVKICVNAALVDDVKCALNAIMTMFIGGCITLSELCEYMMILHLGPISCNQCTDAIIDLLTGLYGGNASPTNMSCIIDMLIGYVAANTHGANIDGALLALHIVPMLPIQPILQGVQRMVQAEDAVLLAAKHDHHLCTFLKVSCGGTQRKHEELFKQIGRSHMDAVEKQYARMKRYNRVHL